MEILRVIVITLAASIIALGVGALVASQIANTIANMSGYGTLALCTAGGVIACSATETAINTFTTVASFFAIIAIAMLGWYVISLFAGGKSGGGA